MSEKKEKSIFVKLLMLLWYCISHPLVWLWKKAYTFFSGLNYRRIGSRTVHAVGNFMHWLIFKVLLPKKYRNITKREIYRIIFKADTPAGKKFDIIMTEVYNVIANIPYILLISVVVLIMSASFWSMVFALTVTGWIGIAYFIRTQVIIIRDREYNLASRCLGTPITRIATKNILPFMTSVIVTLAATEIPSYISYEVFLSYIGMGLKDMSLGKLIESAQSAMVTPGWEIEFWRPVAVASIITVVLYVVGQNLGDASDPRTHM